MTRPAPKQAQLAAAVETIAGECIAVRMRLLNRAVTRIFDEALRPLGVKVSQLNVLMVVAKLGPVSPGDVARRLHLEKSTLSRNVERLRARGWLEVSRGPTERRRSLELGAAGKRLVVDALPLWRRAQSDVEALLGERGARSIHRAADTVWRRSRTG